jgi:hypothetical protein
MPIHVNLLAETQALEELRRRDPVKRAIWLAGLAVFLALCWSVLLQLRTATAKSELQAMERRWESLEKPYEAASLNLKKTAEIEAKLNALTRLSTNRILWATVLNALQQTTVDHIRLTRIRAEQSFTIIPPVAAQKTSTRTIPAQPGASIEQATLLLDARDYGDPEDQNYNKFRQTLAQFPFFQEFLQRNDGFVFAGTVGMVTPDAKEPGRTFVPFALEARLPEVRRNE